MDIKIDKPFTFWDNKNITKNRLAAVLLVFRGDAAIFRSLKYEVLPDSSF